MRTNKTLLLTVSDVRNLIHHVGLEAFFHALAAEIEKDFKRWPEFNKAPRVADHSTDGVIELMPTSDKVHFAFKYVNGHPKNPLHGLPTVMGFGCLAEVATGWPMLISEMTVLTGIRTAAMSAVAARALCNPEPSVMALIGNGAQSEFQAIAFHYLLGINRFNLFDIAETATHRLINNLDGIEGLHLTQVASVVEAVKGAQIVTTATASKERASVLTTSLIEPGMHINAIGGDCPGKTEIDPRVLKRSRVFVEFEPQTRVEGEIQQMPADFPVTALWQVLAGEVSGRTSAEDVTLFDSVGFSIEDFSTLKLVYRLAMEHQIGTLIELIPSMTDVKDLYGSLRRSSP